MQRLWKLVLPIFCAYSLSLSAAESQETFPKQVTVDYEGKNVTLNETGSAARKKFFVKVYSIAHYLQEGSSPNGQDPFTFLLEDGPIKQYTMKWSRDVPASKIKETYHESFKSALTPHEHQAIHQEIETYISFFGQDAKKGDEYALRWLPKGNIEVYINGSKVGSIANVAFAKALWNLWLGNKSVVDRKQLVSMLK